MLMFSKSGWTSKDLTPFQTREVCISLHQVGSFVYITHAVTHEILVFDLPAPCQSLAEKRSLAESKETFHYENYLQFLVR